MKFKCHLFALTLLGVLLRGAGGILCEMPHTSLYAGCFVADCRKSTLLFNT